MHDSRSRSRLFAPGGTRCSWPPLAARLLGAMATIPKPFLLHQVLDAVARVLATDQASETA
jgi:hypothetical protein